MGVGGALSKGASAIGNSVANAGKSAFKNTKDIYKDFGNQCKEVSDNLRKNRGQINSDDALADRAFFAFLADFIEDFRKNTQKKSNDFNELVEELKENDKLTKERLSKILEMELVNNENLTNDKKIGIQKTFGDELGKEIAVELLASKIKKINDYKKEAKNFGLSDEDIEKKISLDSDFNISSKDIQNMTAGKFESAINKSSDVALNFAIGADSKDIDLGGKVIEDIGKKQNAK